MNNDFGLSLKATFKKTEIKELSKEVTEKFEEFIKKYNIDINDRENPVAILYKENMRIKDSVNDKSYKTVKEFTKVEGKLELIRKCIELIDKEKREEI